MKKIWIACLVACLVVFAPAPASASTIHSIDIVAEVQSDGSAIITDIRTFEATEGTEHYIALKNIGQSEVRDFSVVLDGEPLTDVGEWDVNRDREAKAGQSGVVRLADGYELAFGFGEYGTHTAVMTYTVTNFVENLEDGQQTIYWQFISQDTTHTDAVSISITNSLGYKYTEGNTRIWGYGYEGTTAIGPDAITAATDAPIDSRDYMTLLVIFPEAPFTAATTNPMTAEELEAEANQGSSWEHEGQEGDPVQGLKRDAKAVAPGMARYVGLFALLYVGSSVWRKYQAKHRRDEAHQEQALGLFRPTAAATVGREDYWREIPYQGDILDVVAIYGQPLPNLATAYLLEWVREGSLREVIEESGVIFKKEESAFVLGRPPHVNSEIEKQYWEFIVQAARDDGVLQRKEIEKFTSRNLARLQEWQAAARAESRRRLTSRGLMTSFDKPALFGLTTKRVDRMTQEGMNLKNTMTAFANYLRDFSLLNERSASNVALWDQYMVWAGFLGIADEVRDQFNIVDPTYETRTTVSTTAVHSANSYGRHMRETYSRAQAAASRGGGGRSSSRGGGGRSSSRGGGRGARGGGGGGGIR